MSVDKFFIAIVKESHDELCLVVCDHIIGARKGLSGVLLGGNATSSPGRLCIEHKLLKSVGIANVGEANDDDSMCLEVLEMKANDRGEAVLLSNSQKARTSGGWNELTAINLGIADSCKLVGIPQISTQRPRWSSVEKIPSRRVMVCKSIDSGSAPRSIAIFSRSATSLAACSLGYQMRALVKRASRSSGTEPASRLFTPVAPSSAPGPVPTLPPAMYVEETPAPVADATDPPGVNAFAIGESGLTALLAEGLTRKTSSL